METVVYAMWAAFLLGLGAGARRLGAIIMGVLREPLPGHLAGGGTDHNRDSAAASGSPDPTPGSPPRHTSVSRGPASPRWSEMLAETLREAQAVMGN